jgi:imidazoleglycerol-phosphate dehydratase
MAVRLATGAEGAADVVTGIPILDHLLASLARAGRFDLRLELAPGDPQTEVAAAGRELGEALRPLLRAEGAAGHGIGAMPASEALAIVVLEVSDEPLVRANVDLTASRVGGIGGDVVASFLHELAEGAGLTVHVRLLEGDDTQHVLDAIFKALGVALAAAARSDR